MPDLNNGGKKEFPMELRLLLAFLLMGVVLFVTPYIFKSTAPPEAQKKAPAQTTAEQTQQPETTAPQAGAPAAAQSKDPATAPAAEAVPAVTAQSAQEHVVDTSLFRVVFSNQGAVVRSWTLKRYKSVEESLDLVNPAAAKVPNPFSLVFKDQKPAVDVNEALYAMKVEEGGLGVTFEFSTGSTSVRKQFRFQPDSYLFDISTEVRESGRFLPHLIAWRGGFGDMAVHSPAAGQRTLRFDLTENELVTVDVGDAKDGPISASGNYSFAGIADNYFTAAFVPEGTRSTEIMTFADAVPTVVTKEEELFPGMAVGGSGQNSFQVFVGPKDIDILRKVNPKLEALVDFGWFSILAKPLFMGLHWIHDHWVGNWGWAIVIITIFINFALFPLRLTSLKSMKKMQALQPQIKAINDKYKNVGLRDPKKQQQNQEVMELYKRNGVNPMGGCLPMVLQIPFFIAFYNVLSSSIQLRHADWLWVTDLSQPEHLPIKILPIAMIISQFFMQKMTPSTSIDPAQQRIMMMMPLLLGFMFYWVASGLVLYWLTGNLIGIAQQLFFNKTGTAADVAPAAPKRKGKK
jgi:YidC/Oxa1 family membrane protein insertase